MITFLPEPGFATKFSDSDTSERWKSAATSYSRSYKVYLEVGAQLITLCADGSVWFRTSTELKEHREARTLLEVEGNSTFGRLDAKFVETSNFRISAVKWASWVKSFILKPKYVKELSAIKLIILRQTRKLRSVPPAYRGFISRGEIVNVPQYRFGETMNRSKNDCLRFLRETFAFQTFVNALIPSNEYIAVPGRAICAREPSKYSTIYLSFTHFALYFAMWTAFSIAVAVELENGTHCTSNDEYWYY